jgi:replicative DNA helicase
MPASPEEIAARLHPRHVARRAATAHGEPPDELWEPPVPFADYDLPDFPTDALPPWLREFVEAEALATQTPQDLAGMLALSVLATACAGKVRVALREAYEEPINLFTLTVLPSGNRKSAVFRDITAPVEAFETSQLAKLKDSIAAGEQQRRILKNRLEHLEDRAAKAQGADTPKLIEDANRTRRELTALTVPTLPRLIIDECTPERLATLLFENKGRLAQLSAEGDAFDIIAGRYSATGAANFTVYLKGHAGDQLRIDRVGRGSEHIPSPALTVGLAVQPEVLHGIMARPGFRGRGLLARFLYALPKSLLGHRNVEAPPVPSEVRSVYHSAMLTLLELSPCNDVGGNETAHVLRLDAVARGALLNFERELEPRLGDMGDLAHMADWAGKLVGATVRIAGLLHMAEQVGRDAPWDILIASDCAERAIRVAAYLTSHARAAFGQMGADPDIEQARHLLRWLTRYKLATFTKRQAYEGTKGRFHRVVAMEPALALLQEHRFIRSGAAGPTRSQGRKPSPVFEVNPFWQSHNSQYSQIEWRDGPSANSANTANGQSAEGWACR